MLTPILSLKSRVVPLPFREKIAIDQLRCFSNAQGADVLKQKKAFHLPLNPGDTPTQTIGCRHTNPDTCARNHMPKKCCFVRKDNVCLSPPASWKKQYQKLLAEAEAEQGG